MIRWAAPVSVFLHGAVLFLLLPHGEARRDLPDQPPLEVELIQEDSATRGTPVAAETPPNTRDPEPGDGPAPPPPRPPSQLQVDLGNSQEWRDGLVVTSRDVLPPQPDSRFRNMPPRYPAAAARVRAEGTVGLLIHVDPTGAAAFVEVERSSGNDALDRAAMEAVQRWRFRPAMAGDKPVPFDYGINIDFVIGNHR